MDSIFNLREQMLFNQSLNWFLSSKSAALDNDDGWSSGVFARTLAQNYRYLIKNHSFGDQLTISIPGFAVPKTYTDFQYLKPVFELKNFISERIDCFVLHFLLHGSLSTLDYVKGWSDLDTLVVVKSSTLLAPEHVLNLRKRLIEAEKFLTRLDPLQHHGFIICTELDLTRYSNHCIPISVWSNATSLLGSKKAFISFKPYPSLSKEVFHSKVKMFRAAYEKGVLEHHKKDGRYLKESFADRYTMYQLKYFLSSVMMLPALFLDADGRPCYKKESFQLVKEKSSIDWELVEKATVIRNRWSELESYPFTGNWVPDWIVEELGKDYFKRSFTLAQSLASVLGK